MDEVVARVSEPLEKARDESDDEIVRLLTESDADEEWVIVMPGRLITTSSEGPGSALLLQLDGLSQSPLPGYIQVTVESNVRSSSKHGTGWKLREGKRRGRRDRDLENAFRDERSDVRRIGASPLFKDGLRDETS